MEEEEKALVCSDFRQNLLVVAGVGAIVRWILAWIWRRIDRGSWSCVYGRGSKM